MKKNVIVLITLIVLTTSMIFSGCIFFQPTGRLSGPVLFIHSPPAVQDWLNNPNESYVQAYFLFPEGFASDIIFGIDQEFIEGVDNPIHFPGADWMALVGLTRDGVLNIPIGTNESLNGTPSDASVWEQIDLNISLQANTWYFIKEIADFQNRKFKSFTIKGPDINLTVDLSKYYVDYPNYIPIDKRCMTYYVYAVRTIYNMQPGNTTIYFDDVEAGIKTPSGFKIILENGFEQQKNIPDLPITLPITPLSDITEKYWYKENDLALLNITDEISHTGTYSCACDVTFKGLKQKSKIPFTLKKPFQHIFY